jgi:hypothetical protein
MKVGRYRGTHLFVEIKSIENEIWHAVNPAVKGEVRHRCFDITRNTVEEALDGIFFDIRRKGL